MAGPRPLAEKEFLENLILKKKLGITTQQALLEAGYGREEITQMLTPIKTRAKSTARAVSGSPRPVRSSRRVRSPHVPGSPPQHLRAGWLSKGSTYAKARPGPIPPPPTSKTAAANNSPTFRRFFSCLFVPFRGQILSNAPPH